MKTNSKLSALLLTALVVIVALGSAHDLRAQSAGSKKNSKATQWSVQVDKVDPGDVELASAFQIAIYENLLHEMDKTSRFKQVFRSGDRDASSAANLLILKTAVQKYSAGSETKRAVTTVTGATKLNVRTQLCTRDGKVILERVINGNVRFFGSNLRATHNLARNIAKEIKQSPLPDPSASTLEKSRAYKVIVASAAQ
jgi:uncharacterized protein YfcZ (UPF0381/DUF406 family)